MFATPMAQGMGMPQGMSMPQGMGLPQGNVRSSRDFRQGVFSLLQGQFVSFVPSRFAIGCLLCPLILFGFALHQLL